MNRGVRVGEESVGFEMAGNEMAREDREPKAEKMEKCGEDLRST